MFAVLCDCVSVKLGDSPRVVAGFERIFNKSMRGCASFIVAGREQRSQTMS